MKGVLFRAVSGLGAVVVMSTLGGCIPVDGTNGGGSSCESDEVRTRPRDLPRDCYLRCEVQTDCFNGTTCAEVNGGEDLACLPEPVGTNNTNNGNNTANNTANNTNNNPQECTSDAQCSGGTPVCDAGVCVADATNNATNNTTNNTTGCASDADCSGDTPVCDEGECVPAPDPCEGVQCDPGFSCEVGQCVQDPPECTADAQCLAQELCVDGACVPNPDPCAGVQCNQGFSCEAGQCVQDPECTQNSECMAEEICRDGECVPDDSPECIFNSDCMNFEVCQAGECVRDPNIECIVDVECTGANEVCQNNTCVVPVDPVAVACEAFCQNLYGTCPTSTCNSLDAATTSFLSDAYGRCLNGGTTANGTVITPCAQDYVADPQYAAQVDQLGAETCGQSQALEDAYCQSLGLGSQCDCPQPNVGEPCTGDTDCDGGTLNPICIPELDATSGDPTGYVGGYCVAGPCDAGSTNAGAIAVGATTGCGEDGVCLNQQTQSGVASVCYALCENNTECRTGYACEILGFFTSGDAVGRCEPACLTNADCPTYTVGSTGDQLESFCNTDNWCELPCDPTDAGSCSSDGSFVCAARTNFNAGLAFTGSCEVAP